nr:hypothetical protein Itr_chr10CG07830 [Ipomoea trifida]
MVTISNAFQLLLIYVFCCFIDFRPIITFFYHCILSLVCFCFCITKGMDKNTQENTVPSKCSYCKQWFQSVVKLGLHMGVCTEFTKSRTKPVKGKCKGWTSSYPTIHHISSHHISSFK